MTTFQSIIYSLVHGFTEFLPVGATAHDRLLPYALNWPQAGIALQGAVTAGTLLALLIHFRHDWASIISCFIQVIIFRKRPMTLDERLPIFLFISAAPLAIGWTYLDQRINAANWTPVGIATAMAVFGLPLWFSDSFSRKNKGMFDWNWLDALFVGLSMMLAMIPGVGLIGAALPGAFLRNYNRESAAKYVSFCMVPILAASTTAYLKQVDFHASAPEPGLTWLSFSVALIVATVTSLLAIGGFMRQIQRKGMGQYATYRLFAAAAIIALYWFKARSA